MSEWWTVKHRMPVSVVLTEEPQPDDGYQRFVLLTQEERKEIFAAVDALIEALDLAAFDVGAVLSRARSAIAGYEDVQ